MDERVALIGFVVFCVAPEGGAMGETRKIAAILVADVVGYSRLAGTDEDRTLARLRALRSDLIDPTIAVHHGRILKRTGDGALVSSAAWSTQCGAPSPSLRLALLRPLRQDQRRGYPGACLCTVRSALPPKRRSGTIAVGVPALRGEAGDCVATGRRALDGGAIYSELSVV
jgi:class 3 adenylate cyclase